LYNSNHKNYHTKANKKQEHKKIKRRDCELEENGGSHALGIHLLVELRECNSETLKDLRRVTDIMVGAAEEARATVVEATFHEFSPFGISGMVIIAESHLSIHTWPEYSYAAVDIFTCGDVINPHSAANYLIEKFGAKNSAITGIRRGFGFGPHKPKT
jgi:S-adenosylmethionine decarboxylase